MNSLLQIGWRDLTIGSVYEADPIRFSPYKKIKNMIIMLCDYRDGNPRTGGWEVDIYYSNEWASLDHGYKGYEVGIIEDYLDEEELNKGKIYMLAIKKIFEERKTFYL